MNITKLCDPPAALKREKEQLKSQKDTLTGELEKLRNEATVLREKIRNDKVSMDLVFIQFLLI